MTGLFTEAVRLLEEPQHRGTADSGINRTVLSACGILALPCSPLRLRDLRAQVTSVARDLAAAHGVFAQYDLPR